MKYRTHIYQLLFRHKLAVVLTAIFSIGLLTLAFFENSLAKTVTYLITMTGCFLISEFIYFTGRGDFESWKIKKPKKELVVILISIVAGVALLIYWFAIVDQAKIGKACKLFVYIWRALFIFPVFLLVYFLGIERYKPRTIGLWGLRYWFVSLPSIVLIGGVTYLLFPEGMIENPTFQGFLLMGLLTAAIPEEIARTLFQSRLGRILNHKGISWFVVSLIWALQHIPFFASNSGDYYGATLGALGILPIGLLWGYLNERYRSIIPSVLIHGTNIWGLNNIF